MAERIGATIITGFLGAGKTSLIRHLVENNDGRRLAFLINEFGDLGLDRELLLGCGIEGCDEGDIVELTNGCICCTVADDFLPAMEAILDRDEAPHHILIETSGLALPKPLVKAFEWPEIRTRVTVDGVVAVVDAAAFADGRFADDPEAVQRQREADPSLDHENPLEEVFEDQLLCADVIVLNKADLVADREIEDIERTLGYQARPGVRLMRSANARLDPAALIGLGMEAENDLAARPSHHDAVGEHDHDDFATFSVTLDAVHDVGALEARLARAVREHDILRVKGILDRPGIERREVFQAVGPRFQRYFDRPWGANEERATNLVVIGFAGLDREGIEAIIRGDAA